MPPLQDDLSIGVGQSLLRVLRDDWTTVRDGRERPGSLAFIDSNQETSCFLDTHANLRELQRLFPGEKICRFPAAVIRAAGFFIERRPGEVPEDFLGDPSDHVVVGPPEAVGKKDLIRMGKAIATNPLIEIIYPDPSGAI
jgi:hypothetical protein